MMEVNSISNMDNSSRQMQSVGQSQKQENDSVTKDIQTKLQGEERKLKDLSYDNMMSAEEKSKKRQEIRKEISALNRELRQRQMELQREKQQKAQENSEKTTAEQVKEEDTRQQKNAEKESETEKEVPEEKGLSASRVTRMLSAEADMERAGVQSKVTKSIGHQVRVLEAEIGQDKMRGQDVEEKEKQKEKLENIVIKSNSSRADILNEVNKELEVLTEEELKGDRGNVRKTANAQNGQGEEQKRIRISIR